MPTAQGPNATDVTGNFRPVTITDGGPSVADRVVALDGGDVSLLVVAATDGVEPRAETTHADRVTRPTD